MTRFTITALALGLSLVTPAVAQDHAGHAIELGERMAAPEMAKYVRSSLEEMMASFRAVTKMMDQARRDDHDPERVQCLQSRLSYIRALMMVSERANGAMKESQASGNADRSEHEFRKIVVATAKVRQFLAEAEACLGESGSTPGTSELQLAESGLEQGNELDPMDDYFFVVGLTPPDSSPFQ